MDILFAGVMLLGGILAISGLIIANRPNAKQMIDKLLPFQVIIGVALVGFGMWAVIHFRGELSSSNFSANSIKSGAILVMIAAAILLGGMFGMPQFVKWMPSQGNNAHKVAEIAQKIAPFQVLIGLAGLAATLVFLYYRFIGLDIPLPS